MFNDIFYVVKQGLCYGKKNALKAVAGILSGNIIYILLVGFGLKTIGENIYFQIFLGFFGGVYLLKISILSFREKVVLEKNCVISKNIYLEALILNLSNPKAMLFFAIIVTPFIEQNLIFNLGLLFLGISTAFLLAAFISSRLEIEAKVLDIINKIASILFFFFAIKLFLFSFERIINFTSNHIS